MPELPEVENVRRSLVPHLVGRSIERIVVRDTRLRWLVDRRALSRWVKNARVEGIRRRAKYLLVDLAGPRANSILLVHLGMTGRFLLTPRDASFANHTHVVIDLDGDARQLRFVDPRRFGMVEAFAAGLEAEHPRLRHLGLEPLAPETTGEELARRAHRRQAPVKAFLMDARHIVGVGNIYACEALHAAGVHPATAAGRLSEARWQRLTHAVRSILERAIESGGTTFSDFQNAEGSPGEYAGQLAVYGREGLPCLVCGRPVRRMVQSGRSTFYCGACQRR